MGNSLYRVHEPTETVCGEGVACFPSRVSFRKSNKRIEEFAEWDAAVEGLRNFFCPYYEGCVEYASDKDWQSFACTNCPHKANSSLNEPLS